MRETRGNREKPQYDCAQLYATVNAALSRCLDRRPTAWLFAIPINVRSLRYLSPEAHTLVTLFHPEPPALATHTIDPTTMS
jgi:hypothetical protein